MQKPIDEGMFAIDTVDQACDHYFPLLVSGKIDLMGLKKELRENRHFSEEDIRITTRVLSNELMQETAIQSRISNAYFGLIVGIVILLAGGALTIYLWKRGFIALLALFIIGFGLILIFKSNQAIGRRR